MSSVVAVAVAVAVNVAAAAAIVVAAAAASTRHKSFEKVKVHTPTWHVAVSEATTHARRMSAAIVKWLSLLAASNMNMIYARQQHQTVAVAGDPLKQPH